MTNFHYTSYTFCYTHYAFLLHFPTLTTLWYTLLRFFGYTLTQILHFTTLFYAFLTTLFVDFDHKPILHFGTLDHLTIWSTTYPYVLSSRISVDDQMVSEPSDHLSNLSLYSLTTIWPMSDQYLTNVWACDECLTKIMSATKKGNKMIWPASERKFCTDRSHDDVSDPNREFNAETTHPPTHEMIGTPYESKFRTHPSHNDVSDPKWKYPLGLGLHASQTNSTLFYTFQG
jgi:hypothetical protein